VKLETEASLGRSSRLISRHDRKRKHDELLQEELETSLTEEVEVTEEVVVEEEIETVSESEPVTPEVCFAHDMTQTPQFPMLSEDNFRFNDKIIHTFTGLESYDKFLFVLSTLGPAAYCLKYIYFQVVGVSVKNQFFITLIKLREYETNTKLSFFFSISESCVKNIVYTWIIFMSKQWREANIWPCQKLVRYFIPSDFKAKFPCTRVIVDGTECPIKKPKSPLAQQATWSTYKNRNTVKVLVGSTPGGLVSFISDAYGGSTSDRQIVERSSLVQMCDHYDSVMADKGFNVQDLFASRNVTVNMPTFFRKKNRMSGKTVLKDRRISSKRVHVERIIGLGKTYTILKNLLNSTETKLSSHIIYNCFMLCNFRTRIVSKYA